MAPMMVVILTIFNQVFLYLFCCPSQSPFECVDRSFERRQVLSDQDELGLEQSRVPEHLAHGGADLVDVVCELDDGGVHVVHFRVVCWRFCT